MTLADLEKGQSAKIVSYTDNFDHKLLEMGCVPGNIVKILQTAPGGSPIAIEILGYTLALRKIEAVQIFVEI